MKEFNQSIITSSGRSRRDFGNALDKGKIVGPQLCHVSIQLVHEFNSCEGLDFSIP